MITSMARKQKATARRIFNTIADIGSIFMSLLYILYVSLLLAFDIGTKWLNFCMLGITIVYICFFLIKIFSLNRVSTKKKVQRITRMSIKYSKWAMRLINAIFVGLTLATVELSDNHIIAFIGVMVVSFSFLVSVLWDVAWFMISHRLLELKKGWNELPMEEKTKRVELLIASIIRNIDNISGVDITQSVTEQIVKKLPNQTETK